MLGMMFSRPTRSRNASAAAAASTAAAWRRRAAGCGPTSRRRLAKRLDGVDAGGVDGRHVAQAQDHHRLKGLEIGRCFDQLFRRPKQERPVNAQQRDVGRQDAPLQHMRQAVANVFVGDRRDGCGVGNAIDVEQRGQRKPTATATVRSAKTVSAKVTSQTADGGEAQAAGWRRSRSTRPCCRPRQTARRPAWRAEYSWPAAQRPAECPAE